jgi:hypothetical protein
MGVEFMIAVSWQLTLGNQARGYGLISYLYSPAWHVVEECRL